MFSYFLCNQCFSVLLSLKLRCPICLSTTTNHFRVDHELVDIIQNLNRNFYTTDNCCSSHFDWRDDWRDLIYIHFAVNYKFKKLPEGFSITKSEYSRGIYLEHKVKDLQDRNQHLIELERWVNKLTRT